MIREFETFLTASNAPALAIGVNVGAPIGKAGSSVAESGGAESSFLHGHFAGAAAGGVFLQPGREWK